MKIAPIRTPGGINARPELIALVGDAKPVRANRFFAPWNQLLQGLRGGDTASCKPLLWLVNYRGLQCKKLRLQVSGLPSIVGANAKWTYVPMQDWPNSNRQKSSTGNGSLGIRLGQWHLGNWINSASAQTRTALEIHSDCFWPRVCKNTTTLKSPVSNFYFVVRWSRGRLWTEWWPSPATTLAKECTWSMVPPFWQSFWFTWPVSLFQGQISLQ